MIRLVGRTAETIVLDDLLAAVRDGGSGALVIDGETGMGKSALLEHAASAASGMRVLRGAGIEAQGELPFSTLHLLLREDRDRIDALPGPQARALREALGLSSASSSPSGHDRFLVGLAVLSLLTDLAEDAPLLCLVDDAQWLDHASAETLLFAARRLGSEGIALVFAARSESGWQAPGLPLLRPAPLARDAALSLVGSVPGASALSPGERGHVLELARGNPLALIEITTAFTARRHPDGTVPASPSGHLHDAFRDRIQRLPARTRDVLLVAAAEDTGDLGIILAAAERLGLALPDLRPAEEQGLIDLTTADVVFRHPLSRAAAYRLAPDRTRQATHRALADSHRDAGDDDRRAWHLAAAAAGIDEPTAASLEAAGDGASARGGPAAAAAAYERAARLSPDPSDRHRRLVAAAQAAADAGLLDRAVHLADRADSRAGPDGRSLGDPVTGAALARIRATVRLDQGSPEEAGRTRLAAASAVPDPRTAAAMLHEATVDAWLAGDTRTAVRAAERLAPLFPSLDPAPRALAQAAQGLAAVLSGDRGWPVVREAVSADVPADRLPPSAQVALARHTLQVGADQRACDLAAWAVRDCRNRGTIGLLPDALQALASALLFLDRHAEAHAAAAEAVTLAEDTARAHRAGHVHGILARVAAAIGDAENCQAQAEAARSALGDSPAVAWADCSLGLLALGRDDPDDALRHLRAALSGTTRHTMVCDFAVPDLVEAAVASGQRDLAEWSFPRFARFAEDCGQPWAQAVAHRCRALLAPTASAERHFTAAVRTHHQGGRPLERARTELLYGRWLRRNRRRADARAPLRSALEIFEGIGAAAWTAQARAELRAAGETPPTPRRAHDPLAVLTPQERSVVQLAATGLSNRQIGARLFLSHRTVGYHLNHAYPKLGVTSRSELPALDLPPAGDGAT